MEIKVFSSQLMREGVNDSELQNLVSKFKQYKNSGNTQNYFGRDVEFNRPSSVKAAEIMHVHLNDGQRWGVRLLQFNRTSDTHIVYCRGYSQPNSYLLICLLKNAHEMYRDDIFMLGLADIADRFRNKF